MQQVHAFQETAAAIPYSAPLVPLAADLKTRLFTRIAQEPDIIESPLLALLEHSLEDLKQQADELTWEPMMAASATEIAIWQTDEAHREVAFFVRKSGGGLFPNHADAGGKTVLVLEGGFVETVKSMVWAIALSPSRAQLTSQRLQKVAYFCAYPQWMMKFSAK